MNNLLLAPEHYTDLQKSGLFDDTIRDAKIKAVPPDQHNQRLGRNVADISSMYEIPYPNIDGYSRYKVFYMDGKELGRDGKEKGKYQQLKGTPTRPYISQRVLEIAKKPNKPVWICEGEKKCLKLLQHGEHAIGIAGVWNFRAGKNSDFEDEKDLWSDLKQFVWSGRTVFLAFDNDLWTNQMVRYALYELAFKLYSMGAIIKFVCWS